MVCCFFLASFSFFFFSYMNFPKSITLQTGGLASGALSTRSILCDLAISRACRVSTTSWSPSGLITRTVFARISSLILGRSESLFRRGGDGLLFAIVASNIFSWYCVVLLQVQAAFPYWLPYPVFLK